MGGKWANRLTDKESGEKFGAWLFWTQKRSELDGWVNGGCKHVEGSDSSGSGSGSIEARMASIDSKLSRLEKMMQIMHNYIINGEVIDDEDDEEEKPKRLLK